MLRRTERILENIPVGSLGLISLTGCEELGKKVDDYLVKWRHESGNAFRDDIAFSGYEKDSYLLDARVPRFGSGEAKGVPLPVVNRTICAPEAASAVAATRSFPGALNRFKPLTLTGSP